MPRTNRRRLLSTGPSLHGPNLHVLLEFVVMESSLLDVPLKHMTVCHVIKLTISNVLIGKGKTAADLAGVVTPRARARA